jgi:hypothetical protein
VRLRQLAFVACLAALPACVGEIVDVEGSGDLGMDMPPGDEGGGTPPGTPPENPPPNQFQCRNLVTTNNSGEHNPGQDCSSNCHNHGFTMGGTLVKAAGGGPYVGAVITAVDATGKAIDITTYRNGNFYTKQPITFPVKVYASACPDVRPMVTQVQQADAGCNRGGCHVAGAVGPVNL